MNRTEAFLRNHETETYKALYPAMEGSLIGYLSEILPPKGFGRAIDNAPKRILIDVLGQHLTGQMPPAEKTLALAEFSDSPVLQLADHSDLLLDIETFFHNLFHQIAARERNLRFLFSQQCSRARLCHNVKELAGPGYLHTDVDVLNVFGLSKKRLCHYSAATLKDAYLQFVPMGIRQPLYSRPKLPDVLEPLVGSCYPQAAIAVKTANAHIWRELKMKAKKERLQFDEELTCDVLRGHVEDSSSLLHAILFSPKDRSDFLRCRDSITLAARCRIVKTTTDFFWYDCHGDIRPVRIRYKKGRAELIDGTNGANIDLLLTPEHISHALQDRILYPDLIMSYGALSILPIVIVLGGPSHQESYYIVSKMFNSFSGGEIERANSQSEYSGSRLIGGLLEPSAPIAKLVGNLSRRTELDAFENDALRARLRDTLGTMSYFAYLTSHY